MWPATSFSESARPLRDLDRGEGRPEQRLADGGPHRGRSLGGGRGSFGLRHERADATRCGLRPVGRSARRGAALRAGRLDPLARDRRDPPHRLPPLGPVGGPPRPRRDELGGQDLELRPRDRRPLGHGDPRPPDDPHRRPLPRAPHASLRAGQAPAVPRGPRVPRPHRGRPPAPGLPGRGAPPHARALREGVRRPSRTYYPESRTPSAPSSRSSRSRRAAARS